MTTPYNVVESAHAAYTAAHQKFLWWLAGVGYSAYCLFGRLLPPEIDSGFLIFLNPRGAAIAGLVCVIFSNGAFQRRRTAQRHSLDVTIAWAAEQPAPKKPR